MINLKTGLPRSGKSLTCVDELQTEFNKEGAHRPVFVHGIPDLILPHSPLPLYQTIDSNKSKESVRRLCVDWDSMPDGSLVIIDEAQHLFPPRSSGSAVPAHVSFLNMHGHRGFDILLLTQHPSLIDSAVRHLVGRHQHYRRMMGRDAHIRYEWDNCNATLSSLKNAQTTVSPFPKRAYAAYRSSLLHTRQKFSTPWFLAIPIFALVGLAFAAPSIYRFVRGSTPQSSAAVPGALAAPQPVGAHTVPPTAVATTPNAPRLANPSVEVVGPSSGVASSVPVGVPIYATMASLRNTWPLLVAGCWSIGLRCLCTTNESPPRVVEPPPGACVAVATGLLGPDPGRPSPTPPPAPAAARLGDPGGLLGPLATPAPLGVSQG